MQIVQYCYKFFIVYPRFRYTKEYSWHHFNPIAYTTSVVVLLLSDENIHCVSATEDSEILCCIPPKDISIWYGIRINLIDYL